MNEVLRDNGLDQSYTVQMKIVFFTPGLEIGGIERVFINYANLLSEISNFEIYYLTCYDRGTFINLIDHKVKLINLRTNDLKRSLRKIIKFLKTFKPDYIVTANVATLMILIAKILSRSQVKILASHHNYINNEVKSIVEKKILFRAYNHVAKVIAVSKGIASHLIDRGVKPSKIITLYNPIDTSQIEEEIGSSKNTIKEEIKSYILFVGRISPVKNLELLIKSFQIVRHNHEDLHLVIIGDGPLKSEIEKRYGDLRYIHFMGSVPSPYKFIQEAKLIVLPSYSEAFPTILLESLYLGKTIVSTPTAGANEILNYGQYGYIGQSFDNPQEYANLIDKVLDHPIDSATLHLYYENTFSPNLIVETFIRRCLN